MDSILSQLRRMYSDNGQRDVDFTEQEEKMRASQARLTQATQALVTASVRLNKVAMGVDVPAKDKQQMH